MDKKNYFIYHNDRFMRLSEYFSDNTASKSPSQSPSKSFFPVQKLWSARLSTGLFGSTDCPSGNRGPKSSSEVLLASGDEGLAKLIELGFITCPVCKPEYKNGFWTVAIDAVQKKYSINSLADFTDKDILPYDARRVQWEKIVPIIGEFPSRLYVPQGFKVHDLLSLEIRLRKLNPKLPEIGYLDKNTQPWKFVAYRQQHRELEPIIKFLK
ncbi:MAG: hypothetical protein ACP5NW_04405 [Candidatus Woesearchaeota archaeon]